MNVVSLPRSPFEIITNLARQTAGDHPPAAPATQVIHAALKRNPKAPEPCPMGAHPRELDRRLLLFCPEQGGWHSGE
jgi:hypothetical protein